MGVFDDLALGGVDRLERTLGKRAALKALVPLLDSMPAGPGRARALRRAIEWAAEVDASQLEALCARWAEDGSRRHAEVLPVVRALLVAEHAAAARMLAEAELARAAGSYDEPSALYLLGRCLEAEGDGGALWHYEMAADAAVSQPRLRQAARIRAVRALHRAGRRAQAAHLASELLPLDGADDVDRLAVAQAALEAPGRYRRAAALDVLERLARDGGPGAAAAVAAAARHADASGGALSAIEADRIEAVLAHHPDPVARRVAAERLRALGALARGAPGAAAAAAHTDGAAEAFLPRARAALEGSAPGPRPEDPRAALAWLALSVVHALAHDRVPDARRALSEATERLRAGARVEAPLWTAALLALPRASDAARELSLALLDAGGEAPPRGYRSVADALEAAGRSDEALTALRRAAAHREEGAREALAKRLRHRGWVAANEGRREEAMALLREARRMAGG